MGEGSVPNYISVLAQVFSFDWVRQSQKVAEEYKDQIGLTEDHVDLPSSMLVIQNNAKVLSFFLPPHLFSTF